MFFLIFYGIPALVSAIGQTVFLVELYKEGTTVRTFTYCFLGSLLGTLAPGLNWMTGIVTICVGFEKLDTWLSYKAFFNKRIGGKE